VPELPDVELYLHALRSRIIGQPLERIRIASPFLLRSVDPPIAAVEGRVVRGVSRIGKRVVSELDGDLFVVIHLMISGRFRWKPRGEKIPGKLGLAAFDFPNGTLLLTEAGTKRRASLHLIRGREALTRVDRGGLEVLGSSIDQFGRALTSENHTLKRSLTDPTIFSGIGNAYSDEILHHAKISPIKQTYACEESEIVRLYESVRTVLETWTERLRAETGDAFPEHVTAFREGMSVHGRYRQPCPDCGEPVQRIVYSRNECNYCARCQTGGRLLADRALSRLLHKDWPRTAEELEERLTRG